MNLKLLLVIIFTTSLCTAQDNDKQILNSLDSGEIQRAKSLLQDRVFANPDDEFAINLLGDIAGFDQDWDKAMFFYKKLVEKHPDNAEYNFKYGGALGMKALAVSKLKAVVYISDVKEYLGKAAELDKTHIESRRALVELYMELPGILGGSRDVALKYASQLKHLDPIDGWMARAFIAKADKKEEKAISYYKKAIEASRETKINRNSLNYELGMLSAEYNLDPRYGLELLEVYIRDYSYKDVYSLEWAYYRKSQIQANLKNKSEALRSIEKALTLRDDFKEAKAEKKRIQKL